jgi:chaperone modulatory protein CbpM
MTDSPPHATPAGWRRLHYPPALPPRLALEGFARRAGVHPELVRRFVALGLVEATRDRAGELWLDPAELATVARVQRLRAGLSLNYASIGLVLDLLDRIEELEAALRAGGPVVRAQGRNGRRVQRWT